MPVVGTTVAFEGMPKDEGYLYQGVDDAAAFGQQVLKVYNEPEEWQRLSWFGKKYVVEHFNREIMKKVFGDIIG